MKSNNKGMNKKDLFVILILIVMVVGVILAFYNSSNKPESWTYNDLIDRIESNDVKSLTATPVGSGGNGKLYQIEGIYIKDGSDKETSFTIVVNDETIEYIQTLIVSNQYDFTIEFKELVVVDWVSIITMLILPIGLIIALVVMMKNAGGGNKQAFDFAKSRARLNKKATTTFKDVAGADEEKEEFEEVIDFLKNPQKYFEIGARIPKGILLVGPPGTGKTLMARAVAGEAKVPFYSISGSDFVEMFVGVGASRVRDMFKTAKQNAPCIVFIDEIDAVGRQRGAGLGGGNDEREQTLNQLLVEMDGFADNVGIIVMAATNRSDVLDPALMRAGRFDRQITVGLPDKVGREEILKVHARNKKFDETVNWAQVAKRTVGFSGADLASIINDAAILTVRLRKEKISIQEIDEAIDRRIAGPAKKSKHLTELERRTVAYHEAGHAIIGLLVPESDKVQKVTIVPRGMAGGYVLSTPEDDRFLMTKGELIARITGFLGGRSSEEIFFNDIYFIFLFQIYF